MLTRLHVKNFKRFADISVDLDNPVVLVGPNNSGKTSALQALALWDAGLKRWNEKRGDQKTPERRPGVTIGRRDLVSIPVPDAKALWRDLHIRDSQFANGRQETANIRIDVTVEGEQKEEPWICGLEFDYANPESFYCRPLRVGDNSPVERMPIPEAASHTSVALLPPMSGLSETEDMLQPGAVDVRIGQGRTAEVLRNLCFQVHEFRAQAWDMLVDHIFRLYGARLQVPEYIDSRGQIVMTYLEKNVQLDLSAAGRGLQQTLLLLAFMYNKPNTVLLLDEPDAHLEILRQRENYNLLSDLAHDNGNQLIIATHSEVLLNEAAGKDTVVAFVGSPHPLEGHKHEVRNALAEFGFQDYLQAEETRWVLYLEGSTDLAMLRSFARRLDHHKAIKALERPFVHYVGNAPMKALNHFHSLRVAVPEIQGVALFDNLGRELPQMSPVSGLMWSRNEIENYVTTPATLDAYARMTAKEEALGPLFEPDLERERSEVMRAAIEKVATAAETLGRGNIWEPSIKASEEVLIPVLQQFFSLAGKQRTIRKRDLHQLIDQVPDNELDVEIVEKLDRIAAVANSADPPDLP